MKTVLVVDDDKKIALALAARLKTEGYHILTAHDGITAIKKAIDEKPDAILMDVSMPAGGGFTVSDRLREIPETAMIPIIFMTAKTDPRYFDEAMEKQAVGFVSKPFNGESVVSLVQSVC